VRQTSHALIVYPVVGLLGLAAAMPLLNPSIVMGSSDSRPVEPPAARVVVSSSQPRFVAEAAATEPAVSATRTPATVVASSGDDRWWRTQLDRLGTMSVVKLPNPAPKVAPAAIVDRAQREAAQRDAAQSSSVALVRTAADFRLSTNVPAAIRRWEPLIARAARKYDLDPNLIAALMQTESGGNPNAVSPMNAIGLLQVLNGPSDPEANIDEGAAMLAGHIKRFGSLNLALAAYNAGPNAVVRYGGIPPYDETYKHVTRTLASYAAFRG
jgi:hypothetical protein